MNAFSTATAFGNKDFERLNHSTGVADLNEPDAKACQRRKDSANDGRCKVQAQGLES